VRWQGLGGGVATCVQRIGQGLRDEIRVLAAIDTWLCEHHGIVHHGVTSAGRLAGQVR
jgi:hypothetical protein